MDIAKVLAQLRSELDNIDAAIQSLERLQRGGSRRGRPPRWMAEPEVRQRQATRASTRTRKPTAASEHDAPN